MNQSRIGQATSMSFTPLVGTLAYLWDRQSDQVLMIRRSARPDDDHFGKVNGLGGKVEPDESILESVRRELREEAEVELTSLHFRGTITWTNFGPKREQWLAFLFLADAWEGTPPRSNPEGDLEWVQRADLLAACRDLRSPEAEVLPMWPGDRYFIPMVFDENPQPFHGTMPYDGDEPTEWRYERL